MIHLFWLVLCVKHIFLAQKYKCYALEVRDKMKKRQKEGNQERKKEGKKEEERKKDVIKKKITGKDEEKEG